MHIWHGGALFRKGRNVVNFLIYLFFKIQFSPFLYGCETDLFFVALSASVNSAKIVRCPTMNQWICKRHCTWKEIILPDRISVEIDTKLKIINLIDQSNDRELSRRRIYFQPSCLKEDLCLLNLFLSFIW